MSDKSTRTSVLKLNQLIALRKGAVTRGKERLDAVYKTIQKSDLLIGFTKAYHPKNEEGERYPSERKVVVLRVEDAIKALKADISEELDACAAVDYGNTIAKADIVVEGTTLAKDVPVPLLLHLEKQATDWHTFASKLPVLPSDENWKWSDTQSLWEGEPRETHKTKKVTKHVVVVQATDKHPAQTAVDVQDVVEGHWTTQVFSGAITAERKAKIVEHSYKLLQAVKIAREAANITECSKVEIAGKMMDYIFG